MLINGVRGRDVRPIIHYPHRRRRTGPRGANVDGHAGMVRRVTVMVVHDVRVTRRFGAFRLPVRVNVRLVDAGWDSVAYHSVLLWFWVMTVRGRMPVL